MISVALIPPLGWESYLQYSTGIHMALAIPQCMESAGYVDAFRKTRGMIILDNGEAEGARAQNRVVTEFAKVIGAEEVVLPDVIADKHRTVQKVDEFFTRGGGYDPTMRYMGVAQGTTLLEVQRCIRSFANYRYIPRVAAEVVSPINTIGIPRHLMARLGVSGVRIDLANWIQTEYPYRFDIHLLGASAEWPQELKYANKYAPHIRSIDTSLPFNFATAGLVMAGVAADGTAPGRHPMFMSGRLENIYHKLVKTNIDNYLAWAA